MTTTSSTSRRSRRVFNVVAASVLAGASRGASAQQAITLLKALGFVA